MKESENDKYDLITSMKLTYVDILVVINLIIMSCDIILIKNDVFEYIIYSLIIVINILFVIVRITEVIKIRNKKIKDDAEKYNL